ncbi:thioredoxin-dependent thiol peroxidase [Alicyclobacillus cycloheptanicus]|jgi:peroxiredoxin Q/BCP|uniref:thioredoxin-dependent peroxiredoxin n=1 Tax=Alicyclobacillus cycloheptanicus TaxID=1457 RepID=A0ABT9XFC0_9BACL|nr:thioredoxin-dependent thiol peroxidase [Alicyclobacillus cycloheptanicus]MDQ0188996.1 peroxiredoxin Q/BCP [Alicyclobacillus cycloheptanicus]WDM01661.1 thioredoxin-dependent thiol peroxidase [Alicyclobacillus cycloheptanicus]
MATLEVGQMAPDFALPDQNGNVISLADLRGKVVVLYFYPKDDTPGCTKEACAFRDLNHELAEAGAVVYGVSRDSVKSHEKFAGKYGLNFPLLADETSAVCEAYGVIQDKNMYGRITKGIVRTTFIIDRDGKIARIWPKVKVDGHADEVLAAVKAL